MYYLCFTFDVVVFVLQLFSIVVLFIQRFIAKRIGGVKVKASSIDYG